MKSAKQAKQAEKGITITEIDVRTPTNNSGDESSPVCSELLELAQKNAGEVTKE